MRTELSNIILINCLKKMRSLMFSFDSILKIDGLIVVYLRISGYIGINNFRTTPNKSDIHFFINETQPSLLKALHNSRHFVCKNNLFPFEQHPQCSAVTQSISHGNVKYRFYILVFLMLFN